MCNCQNVNCQELIDRLIWELSRSSGETFKTTLNRLTGQST